MRFVWQITQGIILLTEWEEWKTSQDIIRPRSAPGEGIASIRMDDYFKIFCDNKS